MRILMDLHGKFAKPNKKHGRFRKCGWKFAQKVSESSENWNLNVFFQIRSIAAHGKYGFANPSYLILLVIHEIHYDFVFFFGRKMQCQLAAYWMVDMIPFKMNVIQVELPLESVQQNSHSMLVSWMR